jgi:hypothetical protein
MFICMGFLAVDVSAFGVVMSADSQRVDISDGKNQVIKSRGTERRNPIVVRVGGGFVGLVGFAGTEAIQGLETAEWLRRFITDTSGDDVATFCGRLGKRLTEIWLDDGLKTVMEILVSGEVGGDVQFWYVRNSAGLRLNGFHNASADKFAVVNELDDGYIPKDSQPGEAKADVLRRLMYSIRQGVLLPASPVFDGFANLMGTLYGGQVAGFDPMSSLDDVGQYARVRMEFLKRLCSSKHGIYAPHADSPVGGDVHVYGVTVSGEVREYVKARHDVKIVRPGR